MTSTRMSNYSSTQLLKCVYCGVVANCRDHPIPRMMGGTKTVPSCLECNALLGTRVFNSLGERRLFVQDRLRRKYLHILNAQSDTTASTTGCLKSSIKQTLRLKEIIGDRIVYSCEFPELGGE